MKEKSSMEDDDIVVSRGSNRKIKQYHEDLKKLENDNNKAVFSDREIPNEI
jgi:hypothetical protein